MKTVEQYLAGLTGEQMRAALLKLWAEAGGKETGAETLEKWRAGQSHIRFEEIAQSQPAPKPPLVGKVWKTITVPAYAAKDFAEAVRLGNFDNASSLSDTIRLFGEERVGLDKPVKIDLVEFDRDWWYDEAIAWGVENGNRKPIETAHTMGIAVGLPDEQRERPIVQGGSVRHGRVLCLSGNSDWRFLHRYAVRGYWNRDYLFGFVSEEP